MGVQSGAGRPFWIIVSGLPASGKTTLARALAGVLRGVLASAQEPRLETRHSARQATFQAPIPGTVHLDKDDFLEPLFEGRATIDEALRHRLSRQADTLFTHHALQQPRAVLSSWWQHPLSPLASGTPLQPFITTGRRVIEVHCECPAATAAHRFAARKRHAGHGDRRRSAAQLLRQFEQAQALGPLTAQQALRFSSADSGDNHQPSTKAVQHLAQEVLRHLHGCLAGNLNTPSTEELSINPAQALASKP